MSVFDALFGPADPTGVIDWKSAVAAVSGVEEGDPEDDLDEGFLIELMADFHKSGVDKLAAILAAASAFRKGIVKTQYLGEDVWTEEVWAARGCSRFSFLFLSSILCCTPPL